VFSTLIRITPPNSARNFVISKRVSLTTTLLGKEKGRTKRKVKPEPKETGTTNPRGNRDRTKGPIPKAKDEDEDVEQATRLPALTVTKLAMRLGTASPEKGK
jgi:hypothetical protein